MFILQAEFIGTLLMFAYISGFFVFLISLLRFILFGIHVLQEPFLSTNNHASTMHRFFRLGTFFLISSFGLRLLATIPSLFPSPVQEGFHQVDVSTKVEISLLITVIWFLKSIAAKLSHILHKLRTIHTYNLVIENDSFLQGQEAEDTAHTLERHLHLLKERY